ncbi:polycystic kidney disease 1 like 1 [Xyrichtys novacula]|uniref:Polycystic kidney disease 1 like 1 n=1 Tax=Xyrichtys novacula TaxID=13765 RepID=A0AAV1H926_XYRNO|nr:polycystic kidney disease 1 like 1 [Xyrichtys novacula]
MLHTPGRTRDPDPVTCRIRCLEKGFQVAGLTSADCYCGNWKHSLVGSECLNTSYKEETKEVRGERQSVLSLPVGGGEGSVALYRAEGLFLLRVCLSVSAHRVQVGETFAVEVSGKLAGHPSQPTGLRGVDREELSFVKVEFEEPAPKGQSSHHVTVLDDGSFAQSADWVFGSPRKYQLSVTVSNPLSALSSTVHLSVYQPSLHSLVFFVLHGPLGVPPCSSSPQTDVTNVTVETVYRGDPVTLEAHLADGSAAEFNWKLTHEGNETNMEDMRKFHLPCCESVNTTIKWIFETEGVYIVSVNASGAFGWTQEKRHIVVVRPTVPDLGVNESGNQLTPSEGVSVDVSPQIKNTMVHVEGSRMPSLPVSVNPTQQPPTGQNPVHGSAHNVQIYAANQAYPTNTDITLLAVAQVPDPVEFLWHFGDSTSIRTNSRTILKRYQKPGRYDIVVVMSSSWGTVTSDVFPLVVQRAVKLNKLLHPTSVLQNQTVMMSCRVSVGTDVTFLWNFGDGSRRAGQSREQHVYLRTGEFTVTVTVSNLVSSASLSRHIFVVDRPCQPPPVKNMGPLKVQVRRHEVTRLGVTYDTEVDCDISGGLHYTWTLFDFAGHVFGLPLIDTHRQSLVLPEFLLNYDTYTAVARVQVVGSVVYSNYSVSVQVIPSPPVAFIQGGTNIFINNHNTSVVTLDGQRSYDPDFPENPLSFSWTCKPVSSIPSSCFHQSVPSSSPVLEFPTSFLKHDFDQFQFTLTVHSGQRSTSIETFVTLTQNVIREVSIDCSQCQGDQLNWDQLFSFRAVCKGCDTSSDDVQYSWSLYLVNASSKPVTDVPFCYTLDLGAPINIWEGSAASPPHTPGMSTLHPPVSDTSHDIHAFSASEARAGKLNPNPNPTESSIFSKDDRKKSREEPFYHPQGGFHPRELSHSSTKYQSLALDNGSIQYSEHFDSDVISESPIDLDSSADWDLSFPVSESGDSGVGRDYDAAWMSPDEGDPGISAGRPTGVDGETYSAGDYEEFHPTFHEDEGSNLVDDRPSVTTRDPVLLDLHRDPVDRSVFESYTYTGISSPLLSLRPFSLRPGSRYMLEVMASSQDGFLGRSQLFFKTNPTPKGMRCQVQPMTGQELYTHFSIFCTSGKEDLVYEYSFSVGDRPPRMLYQGRDIQHYFSLPSGDPKDDYKVTINTEIRSSTHGTATRPCPVTVQVQPSFFRSDSSSSGLDPDKELSEAGLRNLSALLQLGNNNEIRNYIALLSDILNRLSRDTEANTRIQKLTRNVLICTLCELESSEQASMIDNTHILENLLQVTHQVTLASAKRVMFHVKAISKRLSQSRAPGWYHLDQKTLNTLVALLSYSLQAAVNRDDSSLAKSVSGDTKWTSESASHGYDRKNDSSSGEKLSTKQVLQLKADILQTATDLMLEYILFHEASEHKVSTGFVFLHAGHQNQTSTIIKGVSSTFYLPSSLIRHRENERPCVLSMLTELTHNPYTQAGQPGQPSGPVVDLSLYKCGSKRKIPVRSLAQPINIELQPPQRTKSFASDHILLPGQINYHTFNITQQHLQQAIQICVVLKPSLNKAFPVMLLFRMFERPTPSMNHLRKIHHWETNTLCIALPPYYLNAAGVGHLALLNDDFRKAATQKHLSERLSYSLTVDTSLCLSWDDHQGAWTQHGCRTQPTRTSAAVNCSCQQFRPLTVVQQQIQSSHDAAGLDPFLSVPTDLTVLGVLMLCVCLYIPGIMACRQADIVSKANCRVHYLSDNSPQDPYLYTVTVHTGPWSAAHMSAKVYIALKGEDGVSQTKQLQVPGCTLFRPNSQDTFILSAADSLGEMLGVHIWHDNSGPCPTWYLRHVEVSELNRGNVKSRAWLFVGRCWLAVSKGDGRVERMLQVSNKGMSFSKMLTLKLSDYLADHHMWVSILSSPHPNSFTCTQRLSVSLLLLMGYACMNTVIISQMEDQLLFEVGFIHASAVSVTTGIVSVVAVLPAAALISFLFRLREVKLSGPEVQNRDSRDTEKVFFGDALSVTDSVSEPHLFWSSVHQWAQEAWRNKYQSTDLQSVSSTCVENKKTDKDPAVQTDEAIRKEHALIFDGQLGPELQNSSHVSGKEFDLFSESNRFNGSQKSLLSVTQDGAQTCQKETDLTGEKEKSSHHGASLSNHSRCDDTSIGPKRRRFRPVSQWSHSLAWTLCVLLSVSCLVLSAVLGLRFSSSKLLLWIHSLFFSLMSCIFVIQPAVIITVAVAVSFWYRNRADVYRFAKVREFETADTKLWSQDGSNQQEDQIWKTAFLQKRCSNLDKLLRARQRARYLRYVRPPTQAELRTTRGKKRRETLLCKTLRDLSVCFSMLFLMLCMNYSSSSIDHSHLNKAVRKHFIRSQDSAFMSIQKYDEWWRWAQTCLLHSLYINASTATKTHILIGEPILWKIDKSSSFQGKVSGRNLTPEYLHSVLSWSKTPTHSHSHHSSVNRPETPPRTCGQWGCNFGQNASISLGHRRSDAASKLKLLHSGDWLSRQTAAVKVQFTLFSPGANLFTGVTMMAEQSSTGVLLPSVRVQSVRVYHTPAVGDYVAMASQLLFLFLSLLQICDQAYSAGQQGLMGYWRRPSNWLEVGLLIVTLVYYSCHIYRSVVVLDIVKLLQKHNHRGHVDVAVLANWEQCIHSLCGVLLFLLTMKCLTVLRRIRMFATSAKLLSRTLSRLLWPMISCLVLMVALSYIGKLLLTRSCWTFILSSCSSQTLHCQYHGGRASKGRLCSGCDPLYLGVLHMSFIVWTAMAVGVASCLVRDAKTSQTRGNVFTVTELTNYIRQRVSKITGCACRSPWIENEVEERTYHLEEFESLLDELLFKLNVLSDSLHYSLPPKAHHYREHSPDATLIQELLFKNTQASSPHFSFVASSNSRQPATKAKENTRQKESASLITVCTQGKSMKIVQKNDKEDSHWVSKAQAVHTEVVVEVLVHEEPGSLLSDKQKSLY